MNVPLFARMWPEIKRKLFHLTALIYVVGIIYLPRRTYLAILGAALAAVLVVETIRLHRPAVNAWFQRRFGGLMRPAEGGRMSGVVWMLGGVLVTVALVEPVAIGAAALLYVVLGDTLASLVGIRVGGAHWPRSRKRISGSVACFTTCMFIGAVILLPDYGWYGVVVGAVAATALEAGIFPLDDNFTIPVGSAIALLAANRLMPFSGLL